MDGTEKLGWYTCANCGGHFQMPEGASFAAKAEAQQLFRGHKPQDLAVVCQPCFRKLLPEVQRSRPSA